MANQARIATHISEAKKYTVMTSRKIVMLDESHTEIASSRSAPTSHQLVGPARFIWLFSQMGSSFCRRPYDKSPTVWCLCNGLSFGNAHIYVDKGSGLYPVGVVPLGFADPLKAFLLI